MQLTRPPRGSLVRGFNLIELMITLLIMALLLMLAVPNFRVWIDSARLRTAAEALQNDLRLAQGTAVAQAHQTTLVLTNSVPNGTTGLPAAGAGAAALYWYVEQIPNAYDVNPASLIDQSPVGTAARVQIKAYQGLPGAITGTGVTAVCYSSLGRQVTNTTTAPGPCTASDMTFELTMPSDTNARVLDVVASLGGQVRLCDPSVSLATEPFGCN